MGISQLDLYGTNGLIVSFFLNNYKGRFFEADSNKVTTMSIMTKREVGVGLSKHNFGIKIK